MNNPTRKKAFWLTAATAAMTAAAIPATAEVYLNESQALGVILGDKAIVRREQKALDPVLRKKLEQASNLQFSESGYTFFIATQDGKPAKYAIVLNEIGKSEPITFMVGMTPEGKVSEVVIMEFRENRGWEVKEKRFLNQFRGKTVRNAIRVDEDIINYTGATLSSKAIARGVKRALLLLDIFYPGDARYKLNAAQDFAWPMVLAPIVTTQSSQGNVGLYRQVRYAMGTQCEIRVWCGSAEEARRLFSHGFAELERLEQIFSAYREDSELSYVNRTAAISSVKVSRDFFDVTKESLSYSRETKGAVDITIGPLLEVWRIGQDKKCSSTPAEIAEAQNLVGDENVILDESARTVRFRHQGMKLDFGGIAKGYAADRIARRLEESGALSALVNLGRSSLSASGMNGAISACNFAGDVRSRVAQWPIGIAHPDGKTLPPLFLFLNAGMSLSTSGTSEQEFPANGKQFSHIIHPKTGMPLEGTSSATVITGNGIQSEVASKELLLTNPCDRTDWDKNRPVTGWIHFEISPEGKFIESISGEV